MIILRQIGAAPVTPDATFPIGLLSLFPTHVATKTLGVHVSPFGNFVTVGPLKTFNVGKEDYMTNLKNPEDYIQKVHHLMPGLRAEDLKPHYAGIMAVLKGSTDFIIKRDDVFPNCIQLVGMDSPAWTSCLAVAKYVKELIHK